MLPKTPTSESSNIALVSGGVLRFNPLAYAVWMPGYALSRCCLLDNSTCCVENALNLRDFLEGKDCELIVTDSKEGDESGGLAVDSLPGFVVQSWRHSHDRKL